MAGHKRTVKNTEPTSVKKTKPVPIQKTEPIPTVREKIKPEKFRSQMILDVIKSVFDRISAYHNRIDIRIVHRGANKAVAIATPRGVAEGYCVEAIVHYMNKLYDDPLDTDFYNFCLAAFRGHLRTLREERRVILN